LLFDKVKEQVDALSALLGARDKMQIDSGEVTLLPVEDRGRIVAYAEVLRSAAAAVHETTIVRSTEQSVQSESSC